MREESPKGKSSRTPFANSTQSFSPECYLALNHAKVTIEDARQELEKYRSNTKKIVSIISLLIGFCVATAGVRVLQPFVDSIDLDKMQINFFHALDIILTASLISGGSEGINRLTSVYESFTSSAARNAEKQNTPSEGNSPAGQV